MARGTVTGYQKKFEEVVSQVIFTEEIAISCFFGELKNEIQALMRMFRPSSLVYTYMATLQEVTITALRENSFAYSKKLSLSLLISNL